MSDIPRTSDIRAAVVVLEEKEVEYLEAYNDLVDICAKGAGVCGSEAGVTAFSLLGRDGGWNDSVEEHGKILRRGAALLTAMMTEPEIFFDLVKAEPKGGVQ